MLVPIYHYLDSEVLPYIPADHRRHLLLQADWPTLLEKVP